MYAHYSSNCFSVEHSATRLRFPFCCRLDRFCTAVSIMQVDGLHALEGFIVAFFNSTESAKLVGCL